MKLSVRDLATIFNVTERQIFRWINEDGLPSRELDGRPYFNQIELLEWAITRSHWFSPAILQENPRSEGTSSLKPTSLARSIENAGNPLRLAGKTKNEVLTRMVEGLTLPENADRENLLRLFLAREIKGSTAVGDGIAIPHPQHPVILPIAKPTVWICFLETPVDFGSLDGLPIHTIFTMICPTIRVHLRLLAQVAIALRDPQFRAAIVKRGSRETILRDAERLDRTTMATASPRQATSAIASPETF